MSARRRTYIDFRDRLDRLATSLLPADRIDGTYLEAEEDRIHAYIVLAHAEIEAFLEELGKTTSERARKRSSVTNCAPIVSRLIHFRAAREKSLVGALTDKLIEDACEHYGKLLDKNHGVKSGNVMFIFMPLGLTHIDFDPVLLAELDSFGIIRGGAAHTSARLRQGTSPSKEKKRVDGIVTALSALDQRVRTLV